MRVLKTVVVGAYGNMGREVIKGVLQSQDMQLAGAIDTLGAGNDAGELVGLHKTGVLLGPGLADLLSQKKVDVVIDFSRKEAAAVNVPIALKQKTAVVMGTTGFNDEELAYFDRLARENQVGMFFAPNFSLGAVLMMRYARETARFFPQAEILEYHNDRKKDAPSGTALATAKEMREAAGPEKICRANEADIRGMDICGYKIHSIRLNGLVAHQEVIFAGQGELFTVRHDSLNRECFIPGVLLAARQVHDWQGLRSGLESIMDRFSNPT